VKKRQAIKKERKGISKCFFFSPIDSSSRNTQIINETATRSLDLFISFLFKKDTLQHF
jgi:hypothetical protein